eukprot:182877-Chlamydomonas_euryale.AAC.9
MGDATPGVSLTRRGVVRTAGGETNVAASAASLYSKFATNRRGRRGARCSCGWRGCAHTSLLSKRTADVRPAPRSCCCRRLTLEGAADPPSSTRTRAAARPRPHPFPSARPNSLASRHSSGNIAARQRSACAARRALSPCRLSAPLPAARAENKQAEKARTQAEVPVSWRARDRSPPLTKCSPRRAVARAEHVDVCHAARRPSAAGGAAAAAAAALTGHGPGRHVPHLQGSQPTHRRGAQLGRILGPLLRARRSAAARRAAGGGLGVVDCLHRGNCLCESPAARRASFRVLRGCRPVTDVQGIYLRDQNLVGAGRRQRRAAAPPQHAPRAAPPRRAAAYRRRRSRASSMICGPFRRPPALALLPWRRGRMMGMGPVRSASQCAYLRAPRPGPPLSACMHACGNKRTHPRSARREAAAAARAHDLRRAPRRAQRATGDLGEGKERLLRWQIPTLPSLSRLSRKGR